jgi:mono/diheme cytochrome c family protein
MGVTEQVPQDPECISRRARSFSVNWAGPAMIALAIGTASASSQTAVALPQAWYTQEQADAGRINFNTSCAACHGYSMFTRFLKFSNAEKYFNKISGSMPRWDPGSLPEQDYVNILALMLQETGFPPGDVPLTSDRARLRQIVLPTPHP